MTNSRTDNSIRNSFFVLMEQFSYSILSFICRTVFIYILGKEYLGFSGLFSDVLTLLSLGELGVGTAITYSMYKPAAQRDYQKLAALLGLYKKIYVIIGISITAAGLCLTPFLDYIVSDIPDMPEISIIYILYLFNTTASYFFIYKKSVLITDQRNYIASIIYICTIVLQNIFQIIVLLFHKNYIGYLLIQLVFTIINNLAVSTYVDIHYSFLKQYKNEKLPKEEKQTIFTNIKAMFLSKVSSAVVTSTDNILISAFVSTVTLGIYSNYTLFTNLLKTILTKIFEALSGSVGNLIATSDSGKIYKVFREMWFLNFWIISFSASALFIMINQFITLWIGNEYILQGSVVALVCINIYMRLIRNTFLVFVDTYGLFNKFKLKSVAEAIINLVCSLLFLTVFDLGLYGVLLGTFVSNILTNFWYEPYVIFVKTFKVPWKEYFKTFLNYGCTTLLCTGILYAICNGLIMLDGWFGFSVRALVCFIVYNMIFCLVYRRKDEFKYCISLLKTKSAETFYRLKDSKRNK